MASSTNSYLRGRWAENYAVEYLIQQGLDLITRNYRSPYGEIDVIMHHGQILVFIEVRYRAYNHFGQAGETINANKQRRLYETAQHYIQQHHDCTKLCARFDAVLICGAVNKPKLDWIMNAF